MAGIGGIGLQTALKTYAKHPPLIFMAGGWDERLRRTAIAGGAVAFLENPLTSTFSPTASNRR
ncbi:FixJ family two-component response regulator [Rhizobium sp. BK538]|nr:hypothetical protein [Rhizobium sp. BK538]MBB4168998.1 FixJ family two-component response regulator [Rhizobium sp. BK538]